MFQFSVHDHVRQTCSRKKQPQQQQLSQIRYCEKHISKMHCKTVKTSINIWVMWEIVDRCWNGVMVKIVNENQSKGGSDKKSRRQMKTTTKDWKWKGSRQGA